MSYNKFLDEAGDLSEWRKKNNLPDQNYERTFENLRDQWIKDNRLSELISFIHENWDSGQWTDFFAPLESHLLKNKLTNEYKRFWKGLIRRRTNDLWDLLKDVDKEVVFCSESASKKGFFIRLFSKKLSPIEQRTIDKRRETLLGLQSYLEGLKQLGEISEVSNTETVIRSVRTLEKPKPNPSADKRKIDESLFWQLIEESRNQAQDKFEFLYILGSKLEQFKVSEIRSFERTFSAKFEQLNHWDQWALAYLARKGCGDDGFDYYKAWVISKGQEAYNDIQNLKLDSIGTHFDEDPQLEEFLYLSEKVYERKTGGLMPPVRIKKQRMQGIQWQEDRLAEDYAEMVDLFEKSR